MANKESARVYVAKHPSGGRADQRLILVERPEGLIGFGTCPHDESQYGPMPVERLADLQHYMTVEAEVAPVEVTSEPQRQALGGLVEAARKLSAPSPELATPMRVFLESIGKREPS